MNSDNLDPTSFSFNRGCSPVGIVLLHGGTGTPQDVRGMGEYLASCGHAVYAPLLPGHGTRPEDLLKVDWPDWVRFAQRIVRLASSECETIFLGGLSLGGLISLVVASNVKQPVHGVITMSAPMFFPNWRVRLLPILQYFVPWQVKNGNYSVVDQTTIQRIADYKKYPTRAMVQALYLQWHTRWNLKNIHAPILIMQGTQDHTISKRSAQFIYDHVASTDKTLRYWSQSGHPITIDGERARVWDCSSQWIRARIQH